MKLSDTLKKRYLAAALAVFSAMTSFSLDHKNITSATPSDSTFPLLVGGIPTQIIWDSTDNAAVRHAVGNLALDFRRICGSEPKVNPKDVKGPAIIIGSLGSEPIKRLIKSKKIDAMELKGKREKYLMQTIENPLPGIDEALVIAGSDRRGTVYGIYELSEQLGVSPWYDWADVPVRIHSDLHIKKGSYTAGEPAVRYRGIFLNDEAPCLTGWVKETYGTEYGDHRFYARVFELLLRLRANFMWPAMWGWSFYADDPDNSRTADEMGIIMGTSHHEPMARNHQEWARHRDEYGAWDYSSNQETIDRFFREGISRAKDTEDIFTIGMRGDGDAPMGGEEGKDHEYVSQDQRNMDLLRKIFKNQRQIIKEETGRRPEERPQVWAMYKEVLKFYDLGLRVPEDVTMLLCDDNWGDVRRLPSPEERNREGGWGMYYHVDYVGAPRNTKWLNVTPIQNLWEQMRLTYDYGVDRIWILNVGDLKPMEYPITLFLDMAWDPTSYNVENLHGHTRDFCAMAFGENQADEAARILDLQCKYAGRVTAEMLDKDTYDLESGEWKQVADDYARLEAEALRQYLMLPEEARDAYRQIILFPVQALSNIYEMYHAQAMNHRLAASGDPQANEWADRVEKCFRRDAQLCAEYNDEMSGGKWKHMMDQKHIGYSSWNDNFPRDTMPEVMRVNPSVNGGYVFLPIDGVVVMEAPHYYSATASPDAEWTEIRGMGRTLGAMALMPYTAAPDGAELRYRIQLTDGSTGTIAPDGNGFALRNGLPGDSIDVHLMLKSNLAFARREGHRLKVGFEGAEPVVVNVTERMDDEPENIYEVMYPTVARRVIEKTVRVKAPNTHDMELVLAPLEPGIVVEKIVLDLGAWKKTYLGGKESPLRGRAAPAHVNK